MIMIILAQFFLFKRPIPTINRAKEKISAIRKKYSLWENIICAIRLDCCAASVNSFFEKREVSIVTQAEQPPHRINIHARTFTKRDGDDGTDDIIRGLKPIVVLLIQTDNPSLAQNTPS